LARTSIAQIEEPEIIRFKTFVNRKGADECWEWKGFRDKDGYGVFNVGRIRSDRASRRAHRIAYFIATNDNPEGLQKDATNVVYCYTQQCHLAANACVRFASQGYPVMEMDGGFEAWQENGLDTEKGSSRASAGQSAFSR